MTLATVTAGGRVTSFKDLLRRPGRPGRSRGRMLKRENAGDNVGSKIDVWTQCDLCRKWRKGVEGSVSCTKCSDLLDTLSDTLRYARRD